MSYCKYFCLKLYFTLSVSAVLRETEKTILILYFPPFSPFLHSNQELIGINSLLPHLQKLSVAIITSGSELNSARLEEGHRFLQGPGSLMYETVSYKGRMAITPQWKPCCDHSVFVLVRNR